MTIEELQKEKQQIEEQINNILNDFQKKHKLLIQDINISSNAYRTTNGIVQNDIQTHIDINLF